MDHRGMHLVSEVPEKGDPTDDPAREDRLVEELYRFAAEGSSDAVVVVRDDRLLFCNTRYPQMLGYSGIDEIARKPTFFAIHPDDRPRLLEYARLRQAGQYAPPRYTVRVFRKDGSVMHVEVSTLRTTYYGEPASLAFLRDVTGHVRAHEELREEREKFAVLVEAAPFGMALIDKENRFLYVNPKFEEMFGYGLSDIPDARTWTHKAFPDHDCRRAAISAWLDESGQQEGRRRRKIFPVTCKDGREKTVHFIRVPMENGLQLMTCEDVTGLRRLRHALRKSAAKYRSIFENAVEGIFQSTPGGRFISVNPAMARMHGYASPKEMIAGITDIGKQVYVRPQDRVELQDALRQRGYLRGYEVEFRSSNKGLSWVSMNIRAVRDDRGEILYYEGTAEDITARKLAEAELRRTADKLRRSLSGTIKAMSRTVEIRDPYTAGHQQRVALLAARIAEAMNLSKEVTAAIEMAGVIHDIGKMAIPAEILSKPKELSAIEYNLIVIHPQTGYDILKDVEFAYPIADMVLQHHERLDGSGYPEGLKGEAIMLEARVLAVADVVESMVSHRPYRPALGIQKALEEIERNRGILYDALVVDACLELFREGGFAFEPEP